MTRERAIKILERHDFSSPMFYWTDREPLETDECYDVIEMAIDALKQPTKYEIEHAISNICKPAGLDEEQFFAVMAQIYYAIMKLYGEEPVMTASGGDNA